MAALNAHQRGQLLLFVRASDIGDREGHHHAVRMACGLLVYRVDQIERVLGIVRLVGLGLNPDGKELGAKITGSDFIQADMADIFRIAIADIEIFVEKTLRSVGVSVNNDRRLVDRLSARSDFDLGGLCGCENAAEACTGQEFDHG